MKKSYFNGLEFSVVPEIQVPDTGRVVPLIGAIVLLTDKISLYHFYLHGQNPLFSLSDSSIGCFTGKKVTNKLTVTILI